MGFWTFLQRTKRIQGIFKKKTADSVVEGGGGIKEGAGVFCKTFISFLPLIQNREGDWGWPDWPAAAIASAPGHGRDQRVGENGLEAEEVRFSPWVGAARGGGSTGGDEL
jgi:hypothetical protein